MSHRLPQLLPDGQTVLFTVTKAGFPSWDDTLIVAQSLATGNRKVLIEGGADARFVATGHLVYLRRGTLMAVPFDVSRLQVTGAAVGLVADVMQAANSQPVQIDTGAGQFAVSETGSLAYVSGGVFHRTDGRSSGSIGRADRSRCAWSPARTLRRASRRTASGSRSTQRRVIGTCGPTMCPEGSPPACRWKAIRVFRSGHPTVRA